MYLSSFRLGDHPELLLDLLGDDGPVAVVANAMDGAHSEVRDAGLAREISDLQLLGLDPHELDLRRYWHDPDGLAAALAGYRLVWVRGGNVFTLRVALHCSGADTVLTDLLRRDALVYAGYSAGCCVLAPNLHGLELVDPPADVRAAYGVEPLWEGLGLLSEPIVPHFRSDHPEAALVEVLHQHYLDTGVPHRTLADGEVIVVNG